MACEVIGLWSACSQDQAGVLCHNKGRREAVPREGGGRGGGGGGGRRRQRSEIVEREGSDFALRQLVEDSSRPCCRNSWKGKKKGGGGRSYGEAAKRRRRRGEKGREFREQGMIGLTVAFTVTSGNDTVGLAEIAALSLPSFILSPFTLHANAPTSSNPVTLLQAFPV